jgi:hypothetical protein
MVNGMQRKPRGCIICGHAMVWAFSKRFDCNGLTTADYWRCQNCGFVISGTHADMSPEQWEDLNRSCHQSYQGSDCNPGDPRWLSRLSSQARVIDDCVRIGLLRTDADWIDYACGDGKLSELVAQSGHCLGKYDKYMAHEDGYLSDASLVAGSFGFVITTSVFEHLTRREHFDAINGLVGDKGVMGLHTLVRERVPDDPSWFYFSPPHCAFHTNRSMQILFEQWGYQSSVYEVDARLWLWFRDDAGVEAIAREANTRNCGINYYYKRGFMNYWKE